MGQNSSSHAPALKAQLKFVATKTSDTESYHRGLPFGKEHRHATAAAASHQQQSERIEGSIRFELKVHSTAICTNNTSRLITDS